MGLEINLISAQHMAEEVAKQTESMILEQLNQLIKRNLLVLEVTHPTMVAVRNEFGTKLEVHRTIKLHLKDREYIMGLEARNKELEETLNKLRAAMGVK